MSKFVGMHALHAPLRLSSSASLTSRCNCLHHPCCQASSSQPVLLRKRLVPGIRIHNITSENIPLKRKEWIETNLPQTHGNTTMNHESFNPRSQLYSTQHLLPYPQSAPCQALPDEKPGSSHATSRSSGFIYIYIQKYPYSHIYIYMLIYWIFPIHDRFSCPSLLDLFSCYVDVSRYSPQRNRHQLCPPRRRSGRARWLSGVPHWGCLA